MSRIFLLEIWYDEKTGKHYSGKDTKKLRNSLIKYPKVLKF
jgi:hypothetical protein